MTIFKGSRYEFVGRFAPDLEGRGTFRGLLPRPVGRSEPIVEHTVALMERLDGLGHHYYGEPRAWYRLAEANPDALFPEDLLFKSDPPPAGERLGAVVLVPRREEAPR